MRLLAIRGELGVADLGLPVVGGGLDGADPVFGDEAQVAHAVLRVAEEQHEQVAGARQLVAHRLQAQVDAVLGVMPECADEALQAAVGAADADAVADDVIGGDGDDAPGDGVLAPGGERVVIQLAAPRRVVVVVRKGRECRLDRLAQPGLSSTRAVTAARAAGGAPRRPRRKSRSRMMVLQMP